MRSALSLVLSSFFLLRRSVLLAGLTFLLLDPFVVLANDDAMAPNKEAQTEGDLYPLREMLKNPHEKALDLNLRRYARELADALFFVEGSADDEKFAAARVGERRTIESLHVYIGDAAAKFEDVFFRGRYDRSRARLPENIDAWRSQPDIGNPGADLANFPNSAFTLPQGRAYIEMSPLTFYGAGLNQAPQFNSEFLLRYGLTDNIEARIFGNGVSWQGSTTTSQGYSPSATGFSPIAFDTKIHLMEEKKELYLPAVGLEAYLQTTWLGTQAFNAGTTPGFTFNFDQSLPFDIDFEYNLGAAQQVDSTGSKIWQFSFQWALQKDLFNKDFAVFVHGFYNSMTLPRLPTLGVSYQETGNHPIQNAVGLGLIWTPNNRVSFWSQCAGGTTQYTPSIISNLGFAVAF